MNKEIEEAIRKCNLFIQAGAIIHIVDCNSKGQLVFKEYDTSAIETVLNYIKEIEKENKNIKDTDLTSVYLKGVYDGKEQARIDSTPNSVIREKMKEIKIKGNEAEKTKENVMFYQGYYIALEEILKEVEK